MLVRIAILRARTFSVVLHYARDQCAWRTPWK